MILDLKDLFSPEELSTLKHLIQAIPDSSFSVHEDLGRLQTNDILLPKEISDKLIDTISAVLGKPVSMVTPVWVEYSNKYGRPNLPPHFDRDSNEFIINYQLASSLNTVWPVGVDCQTYPLTDNSAVAFNPNTHVHWRTHKDLEDGEYIQMIFFRFFDPTNKADYSYLPSHSDDPLFTEIRAFRDNLTLNV
jgi:hypothetical protein